MPDETAKTIVAALNAITDFLANRHPGNPMGRDVSAIRAAIDAVPLPPADDV